MGWPAGARTVSGMPQRWRTLFLNRWGGQWIAKSADDPRPVAIPLPQEAPSAPESVSELALVFPRALPRPPRHQKPIQNKLSAECWRQNDLDRQDFLGDDR